MTKIISQFPVNEKDEILAQRGTGTGTVVGYLPEAAIPVDDATGKMLINIDSKTVGNIGGLDGLICKTAYALSAASGNVDVYTCPANRRAYVTTGAAYNPTGGSISVYPSLKVASTYYQLGNSVAVATVAANPSALNIALGTGIVLEAGETLAMNSSASGINATFQIYEFNATSNFKTYKNLSLASGDNTLYTTPAGKSASLGLSQMNSTGTGQAAAAWNNFGYFNNTGSSVNMYFNYVPSGASAVRMSATNAVTTSNVYSTSVGFNLQAGDSFVVNTSAANNQIAWINVFEI